MRMNRTNLYELVRYSEIDQEVERLVFFINLKRGLHYCACDTTRYDAMQPFL